MTDPEGPGRHAPRQCSTLTLADLGDTVGFREPGDLHTTYGFRLDPKGVYARVPIEHSDDDDWDLQLELRRGFTYTEVGGMLVRLDNLGKALVSFQACKVITKTNQPPSIHYQTFLKVLSPSAFVYGVGALEVPKSKMKYCMRAVTEHTADLIVLDKPPAGSTIWLELIINPAAQTEAVQVLPGVALKWGPSAKPRHIAVVLQSGSDGKFVSRTTEQDIMAEVKEVSVDEIICGVSWVFVRLLFTTTPVTEHHIERLIYKLRR
jgi:hypothetical protein